MATNNNKRKQKLAIGTTLPPLNRPTIHGKVEAPKKGTTTPKQTPAQQASSNQKVFQPHQQRSKTLNPLGSSQRSHVSHTQEDNLQMSISGSPLSKSEQPELRSVDAPMEKRRVRRDQGLGKMSLVCELKLKTLRRELNLLKQTIPPTDDVVEVLREKAAFDLSLIQTLKKTAISSRWDLILSYVQEHPQPGIFGLWEYIIQKGNTQLQPRLKETFNVFVNNHFERDLQNLQLNKDRQNRVAKVMLDNMQKAEGYIDSLNLSIWEYQRYTEKISSLVKDHNKTEELNDKIAQSPVTKHSPSYINVVYNKLENYVTLLEAEGAENADEIEALKIKLYEASGEIEKIQFESKRFHMDNQDKAKEIKELQKEKKQLQLDLDETNRKMDDIKNDKQNVNKKLDEMMNVMVKSMTALRNDVKSDIELEVKGAVKSIDTNMAEMEERMTIKLGDVQDTIDVVQETQDTVREDMTRIEQKMETVQFRKLKDKNVNLKITVKGASIPEEETSEDDFRTRSSTLRRVQRK